MVHKLLIFIMNTLQSLDDQGKQTVIQADSFPLLKVLPPPKGMYEMPYPEIGITEDSLKNSCSHMTSYCKENLTTEKYGPLPGQNRIAGGFYFPTKPSLSSESIVEIDRLAKETGRKFRAGTPFELLFYIQLRLPTPDLFNCISHIWDKKVLFWYPYDFGTKFQLYHSEAKWRIDCGIFIVEDL